MYIQPFYFDAIPVWISEWVTFKLFHEKNNMVTSLLLSYIIHKATRYGHTC